MQDKKLEEVLQNFETIQKKLSEVSSQNFKEYANLSKEYANVKPVAEKINLLFVQILKFQLSFLVDYLNLKNFFKYQNWYKFVEVSRTANLLGGTKL